jgi:hypothetical protein
MRVCVCVVRCAWQLPGEFTRFDFPKGVPAPFNMLWAIARRARACGSERARAAVPEADHAFCERAATRRC